jgi:hypothetical protein
MYSRQEIENVLKAGMNLQTSLQVTLINGNKKRANFAVDALKEY